MPSSLAQTRSSCFGFRLTWNPCRLLVGLLVAHTALWATPSAGATTSDTEERNPAAPKAARLRVDLDRKREEVNQAKVAIARYEEARKRLLVTKNTLEGSRLSDQVQDSELAELRTLQQIVDYMRAQLGGTASPAQPAPAVQLATSASPAQPATRPK
ncbi:MAG: hypothetical protein HZC55_15545 [Verrucomicrobia bacterium]|nr:hypothetical protein [Verrucomicrobiota bacterium]